MSVSQPFADILSARRESFNSLVQAARLSHSSFDSEAFSDFLSTEVDAIIQAVSNVDPDRAGRIAEDIFEMAVNLVAQNRAGPLATDGLINRIWRDVAPNISQLISVDALESLGALTNAGAYVSGQSGVRAEEWLKLLRGVAPRLTSIEHLRYLVTIATWRSGGAHIRKAALEAASMLPIDIASLAIGCPKNGSVTKTLAALAADIWWTPDRQVMSRGHTVGGFVGLGGSFKTPPEIGAVEGGFLMRSDDQYFHLSVDAFGAIIRSVQAEDWSEADAGATNDLPKDFDIAKISMNMPKDDLKVCGNSESVAIASPHSHYIRVLPRRRWS